MKDEKDQIVIIKRYNAPMEAYIDQGMLRENGIECAVDGADTTSMLPYLQDAVTLSVRSQDVTAAEQLLGLN